MLTEPPCIYPLVGCSETDTVDDSSVSIDAGSSDADSSSTDQSNSSSSSSRASYWSVFDGSRSSSSSSASSRSSSSTSVVGTTDGQFVSQYSSDKQRLSVYTVTVRNRGTTELQGVTVLHGPIPSSATLDEDRSSANCNQSDTSVLCSLDLAAGESKELTIVYRVNNSTSCAIARPLQSVQTSSSDALGTVSCVMKNDTISGLSSSAFSSSVSSSGLPAAEYSLHPSSSGAYIAQNTYDPYAYSSSSTKVDDQKPLIVEDGTKDLGKGKGKGYKPYYKPQSGALSDLFSNPNSGSMLFSVDHKTADSAIPMWGTALLGVLGMVIIMAVFYRFLSGKTGFLNT